MRIIGHVDMDAFFAAVEERDKPRLKGKPIVVGADPEGGKGRGVVSTANYKAREYGIRSAMPISEAWRRSEEARRAGKPPAVFMETDGRVYRRVSQEIMEIIRSFVPMVDQVSVDEWYLDISFTGSFKKGLALAKKIKAEIRKKECLTASVGIGPNKLVAKIASDLEKPDGITVIAPERVSEYFDPLPIRALPGIGPKTEIELKKLGIHTVRDLKELSLEELKKRFGKWGLGLYRSARGESDSPMGEVQEAKSIGEQETFVRDTNDPNILTRLVKKLSMKVIERFRRDGWKSFQTVAIAVRFADFDTKSRSRTLKTPASDQSALEFEAMKLLMPFFDKRENPHEKLVRLLGVRIEKLE